METTSINEKELIEFLSKNLSIEVYHPKHYVGYYSHEEPDEHNITVCIKLCDKVICKDTSFLY